MKRIVRDNFDASVAEYDAYERRTGRFSTLARRLGAAMAADRAAPFDRLLEVGAGTGAGTAVLADRAAALVALDASRAMLARNGAGAHVAGDMDRLPFADGAFDAVAYTASLFLVPDPVVAAREARRVLRPGGIVGAVVPVGWFTPDGTDAFADLPRESRSPNGPAAVGGALRAVFGDDLRTERWAFETTADAVRAFHEMPAGAARIYPKAPPAERVRKARTLLAGLPDDLEHRWVCVVAAG